MTIQQKMYETTVKAVGGRNGYIESSSPELRLDIDTQKKWVAPAVQVRIQSSYSQQVILLALTVL